jgi:hypothetical protein
MEIFLVGCVLLGAGLLGHKILIKPSRQSIRIKKQQGQ